MHRIALCLLAWACTVQAGGWTSVRFGDVAVYPGRSAPAIAAAVDEARVAAEVAGRIDALPARVGEQFARGAVLARVDPRSYRIELQRAEAALALVDSRSRLAASQLARAQRLAGAGFVSADALRVQRTELEVLGAERESARQAVAAAQLALQRTVVRAPFDGVVRARLASVGDWAQPGVALLGFSSLAPAELRARVDLAAVEELRAASGLTLRADGREFGLRLLRVSPLVEPAAQAREVVFTADTPLAPGLAGELVWRSPWPHLPAAYLQSREGRLGAYVVVDGAPIFRPIPQAQLGRPVAPGWSPDTELVDEGRLSREITGSGGR